MITTTQKQTRLFFSHSFRLLLFLWDCNANFLQNSPQSTWNSSSMPPAVVDNRWGLWKCPEIATATTNTYLKATQPWQLLIPLHCFVLRKQITYLHSWFICYNGSGILRFKLGLMMIRSMAKSTHKRQTGRGNKWTENKLLIRFIIRNWRLIKHSSSSIGTPVVVFACRRSHQRPSVLFWLIRCRRDRFGKTLNLN